MRFFCSLAVALLVAWAAVKILSGGVVQPVPGTGTESENPARQTTASPVGWTISDTRQLFERNHFVCGFVSNEGFEFDEVTEVKTESTRGTIFGGAGDKVITPAARRLSRHERADYLWCDLGNMRMAGGTTEPGERVNTRNIFVSKNGIVAEFLTITQAINP